MINSREKEFAYQHKTISVANAGVLWLEKHSLVVFLPKDLIQIKNLYVYLAVAFDDEDLNGNPQTNPTPAWLRKIAWIGGDGGRKNVNRGLVNGVVELKYDFSDELELFGLIDGKPVMIDNQKTVKIEFGCGNTSTNGNLLGGLKLWKVDIVYTTQGIR